jgi:hypothetical protein
VGIVSDWLGNLAATPPPDALPIPGLSYNGDGAAASLAAPGVATVPTGDTCPSGYGTIYAWDGSKQCLTPEQIAAAPDIADTIAKGTAPPLQDRVLIGGVATVNKARDALSGALPTLPFGTWGDVASLLAIGVGVVLVAYVVRSFR